MQETRKSGQNSGEILGKGQTSYLCSHRFHYLRLFHPLVYHLGSPWFGQISERHSDPEVPVVTEHGKPGDALATALASSSKEPEMLLCSKRYGRFLII